MKIGRIVNNEKGFSLITIAMATTFAIVTLSMALSVHIDIRRKNITRVKEALRIAETMEVAAKEVRSQWETAALASVAPSLGYGGVSPPPCYTQCYSNYGNLPTLCHENKSMPTQPYCFFNIGLSADNNLEMELKYDVPELQPTRLEVAWSKIFNQKDDLDLVETALAAPLPSPRSDTVGGSALNCVASNRAGSTPGCMVCGPGSGGKSWIAPSEAPTASRVCARIYSCPKIYSACAGYTGASPSGAIFIQDFYVAPPNDKD